MAETMSSNSCRICMSSKMHHSSIFSNDLSRKITEIADVEVQEGDGLPPTICEDCEVDLDKCYKFRVQIQWADSKFRENLSVSEVVFEECQIKQEIAPMHPFMNEDNQDNEDDDDDRGPSDNDDDDYDMREEPEDKTENADKEGNQVTHPLDHVEIIENRTKQEIHMPLTDQNSQEEPLIVAQNMKSENEPTTDPLMHNEPQSMETDNILPGPSTSAPMVLKSQSSKTRLASILGLTKCEEDILRKSGMLSILKKKRAKQNLGEITYENRETVRAELFGTPKPALSDNDKGSDHKRFRSEKNYLGKNMVVFRELKEESSNPNSSLSKSSDMAELSAHDDNQSGTRSTKSSTTSSENRTNDGRLMCSFCQKTFKTKVGLLRHSERIHSDTPADIKCKTCGKRFKFILNLRAHQKDVHSTDTEKFYCDICGKDFASKPKLRKHIHCTHVEVRLFDCSFCSWKFKDKKTLDAHLLSHSDATPFQCGVCNKAFKTKYKLKVHMNDHSDQPLNCKVCYSKFVNLSSFESHRKRCVNPYKCEVCNEECQTQWMLTIHMKLHEDPEMDTFSCSECNKVFESKMKLRRHLLFHAVDNSQLTCDTCDKTFKTNTILKTHMFAVHFNDSSSFKCEICGKRFKHSGAFSSHRRVHTDETFFQCKHCNKSYKWKGAFNYHLQKCGKQPGKPVAGADS